MMFVALMSKLVAQDQAVANIINIGVTNMAANTTNSTVGLPYSLYRGQEPVRLWVTANGTAATTNGSLIVRFSTASGDSSTTNAFDTASYSLIYLTLPTLGTSTNTISDWFQLTGARYIRISSVENNFAGAVSNVTVRIGYNDSNR